MIEIKQKESTVGLYLHLLASLTGNLNIHFYNPGEGGVAASTMVD